MRVLITSGGTKVPIDRVRDITNQSGGNFASKIARKFLEASDYSYSFLNSPKTLNGPPVEPFDISVDFLRAENSISPFEFRANMVHYGIEGIPEALETFSKLAQLWREHGDYYREYVYSDFYEYKDIFLKLVANKKYDVVLVAAAVSDYLVVNYVDGKIRSDSQYSIELTDADKIIPEVKRLCPNCFLVGFKLLVNSTDEQLIVAANKVLDSANCNLVVANDLRDIQAEQHRVILCEKNAKQKIYEGGSNFIAKQIVETVLDKVNYHKGEIL